jgi:hypothetical protein
MAIGAQLILVNSWVVKRSVRRKLRERCHDDGGVGLTFGVVVQNYFPTHMRMQAPKHVSQIKQFNISQMRREPTYLHYT